MIIRFEYNYNMEYLLKTYSTMTIKGQGEWYVDENELSLEYSKSKYEDFRCFIENYFYTELDIDPDYVQFNIEDLNKLKNIV